VGWGEVINGGFGMLIDGSIESEEKINDMLFWDVNNGVARRSWARNDGAISAIQRAMKINKKLKVTIPNIASDELINKLDY
jgi:urocanate hydratase